MKTKFYRMLIKATFLAFTLAAVSCTMDKKTYDPQDNSDIITPAPRPQPRINGPLVYGARPGNPFIYRIPCQGTRPISFTVTGLPESLKLDTSTGIITGTTPEKGEYKLLLEAENVSGRDSREFTIMAGEKLALTPTMGYNHWYAHYDRITQKMMMEAADIMISSGMADVGYEYVNIDDCWMNAPEYRDSSRVGPVRSPDGNIIPNSNFPDMKGLADYIHSKGLKAGLYTSPGTLTCGQFGGAYGYEEKDAKQFAEWGYDFLKYDWCSYGKIANEENKGSKGLPLDAYKKPYILIGRLLKQQKRDIVLNLCQYGMAEVWKWGGEVGGNSWRTAGDLGFELDRIFDVALKNSEHRDYSKPGEWNDPDYIQIGWIGTAAGYGEPKQIQMAPSMQYAYVSLWSLMASPIVYSGDMTKLDAFTLNVLCNPEVIDVDLDPIGESASVIKRSEEQFIMVKHLLNGDLAVGLFNRAKDPAPVTISFDELGIQGVKKIRDLWRQKNIGKYKESFTASVPAQGVIMIRISN